MNIVKKRCLFLYVLMAVFIAPAMPNVTRAFGVQPEGYPQSQVKYHEVGSSDHFSR